jgi:hypothetical protein
MTTVVLGADFINHFNAEHTCRMGYGPENALSPFRKSTVVHRRGRRLNSSEGNERLLSSLIARQRETGAGRHQRMMAMYFNRSDMRMVIETRGASRLKTRVRDTSVQREPYPHSSSRGRLLLPLSLPNHLGLEGRWHGYGLGYAEQRVGHQCLD